MMAALSLDMFQRQPTAHPWRWVSRFRMGRDHATLDKIVCKVVDTVTLKADGTHATGADSKPIFRIGRTRERADAYSWELIVHDVALAGHRVPDFALAIQERLRREDRREQVELLDNPYRIEILKANPMPVFFADYKDSVHWWPLDAGACVFGLRHEINGSYPTGLHFGRVNSDPGVPHVIVAGTTGSGKTTLSVNALVTMCAMNSPATLSLIVIDPKGMNIANSALVDLPHLACPVITEVSDALAVVHQVYAIMQGYRKQAANAVGRWRPPSRIVLFIDELAELVSVDPSIVKVLVSIGRIGREYDINMWLATQRPTHAVISGELLANVPVSVVGMVRDAQEAHIATGIAQTGCEKLPGRGVFNVFKYGRRERVQVFWIDPDKQLPAMVDRLVAAWAGVHPYYRFALAAPQDDSEPEEDSTQVGRPRHDDTALIDKVVALGAENVTINMIRTKLGPEVEGTEIGVNRAKRIRAEAYKKEKANAN